MKENFQDSTVIILATRFSMIVQCDRVIVMNHGRVVEFDTPLGLLDDPKSKFSLMLAQNGDVDPVKLRALAKSRADSIKRTDTSRSSKTRYPGSVSRRSSTANGQETNATVPSSIKVLFENRHDDSE